MNDGPMLYKLEDGFLLTEDHSTLIIQGTKTIDVSTLSEVVAEDLEVEITSIIDGEDSEDSEEEDDDDDDDDDGYRTIVGKLPQLGWGFRLVHSTGRPEAVDSFWADWNLEVDETNLCYSTQCVLAEAIIQKSCPPRL